MASVRAADRASCLAARGAAASLERVWWRIVAPHVLRVAPWWCAVVRFRAPYPCGWQAGNDDWVPSGVPPLAVPPGTDPARHLEPPRFEWRFVL